MKKLITSLALALGLAGAAFAKDMPVLSVDMDRVIVMDGSVSETVALQLSHDNWSFAFGGLNHHLDVPRVITYDLGTPVVLPVLGNLHVSSDSRFDFVGLRGERVLPVTDGLGAHVGVGLLLDRHDLASRPDLRMNLGFTLDVL